MRSASQRVRGPSISRGPRPARDLVGRSAAGRRLADRDRVPRRTSSRSLLMRRTNGSVGHRARAFSAAAMLLGTLLLAYVPSNAASVLALTPDASAPRPIRSRAPRPIRSRAPRPIRSRAPRPIRSRAPRPIRSRSPSPDPIASPSPDPIASPSPDPIASPSPAPNPAATVLHPDHRCRAEGRHRIDPGAAPGDRRIGDRRDQPTSSLSVIIPAGWSIVDAGGGTYDSNLGRVVWDLDPIGAGISVDRLVVLRAPTSSPIDGGLDFEATFASAWRGRRARDRPSATIFVHPPRTRRRQSGST